VQSSPIISGLECNLSSGYPFPLFQPSPAGTLPALQGVAARLSKTSCRQKYCTHVKFFPRVPKELHLSSCPPPASSRPWPMPLAGRRETVRASPAYAPFGCTSSSALLAACVASHSSHHPTAPRPWCGFPAFLRYHPPMRRLFTLPSALSLVLCAAMAVLWVRSYTYTDVATFLPFLHGCSAQTYDGRIYLTHHGNYEHSWGWVSSYDWAHGSFADDLAHYDAPKFHFLGFRHSHLWGTVWFTGIPFWPLVLITAVPLTRLRRMRRNGSMCASCGYDLRATPDRCPECGTKTKIPAGISDGNERTVQPDEISNSETP
jgi:hypothetical protein